MKNQLFDWYGFPVLEWGDECAICGEDGADVDERGVKYHKECLLLVMEPNTSDEEAWRKFLNE